VTDVAETIEILQTLVIQEAASRFFQQHYYLKFLIKQVVEGISDMANHEYER
jgi:hypothetical protein